MQRPKRVLVIMNLATAGRSSMAAVLPVLATCGVQGCPLPTSLLSSHLGGFGEVAMLPTAAQGHLALEKLLAEGLAFDAVYTGYLTGEADFALANLAFDTWPNAFKLVDPALGDGGRLYSKTTPAIVAAMLRLAARADCLTPNLTESALLLGQEPSAPVDEAAARARLARLAAGRSAVITSAPVDGRTGVLGQGADGGVFARQSRTVPVGYPGTGDLFTAALCGLLQRGSALESAASTAARFVEAAAAATYEGGGEARQGVWFEPQLHLLAPCAQ